MVVVTALEMFFLKMKSKNWSASTIKNYGSQVRLFLNYFQNAARAKEIPANEIEKYLTMITCINTRNHARCGIQAFYTLVVNQPMKLANIPWPKKEYKLVQFLEDDEMQRILNVCTNVKHKAIILLLYGCGLRISEVINLKIADIDSDRMIINIIQGKGRKDRQVQLPQTLLDYLRIYYKQYKPSVYMFNGQVSIKYTQRSINSFLSDYGTKAGVKRNVHAHLIRHSFATNSLEQGVDLRLIQTLLGHTNIKTTLRYTHVSTTLISKTHSPISNLLIA